MNYRVKLERDDNDTMVVDFPDFPEAHTFGDDEADALRRAQDALATIIDAYIRARRDIPQPTARPRGPHVAVPPLIEAKVAVYRAMRARKVGKAELARRLGWHLPQVDRVLDVRHKSRLDQLEAAAAAVGKRLVVTLRDAVKSDTPSRPRAVRRAPSRASHGGTRVGQRFDEPEKAVGQRRDGLHGDHHDRARQARGQAVHARPADHRVRRARLPRRRHDR
jgi:antitoxin HicB